ncbi:MAG TPA: TIGR03668 family PPOX class F420-dependent oxidoreductase [Bryobacteraceae bacterium]|nr:TIGR03668 family PPOX class F420-dependent oxidoreductase [Bryobacteraceae bacterium]
MAPSASVRKILKAARVARLATMDAEGKPQIVPVCFAYDGEFFYTAIDRKPKRVPPDRLARLKNIASASNVALLIDHYDEDWSKLWYVLIHGKAKLLPKSAREERARATRKLRAKYPQYTREMLPEMLPDDAPIIRVRPERITSWGRI